MIYIFIFILLILIVIISYFIFNLTKKIKIKKSLETALFLIEVPLKTSKKDNEKDFKSEINLTEQLITNLLFIKEPFSFEIAVPHIGEEIHFYLSIPKKYSQVAEKQIQGLWPGANFTMIYDDYTIFNPNGVVSGAYLTLNKSFSLPIRTYQEIGLDTLNSIISGFSKINEIGEGGAIQIMIKPADKKIKKIITNNLKYLKQGESPEKILGSKNFDIKFSDFTQALNTESSQKEEKQKIIDEDAIKALESKLSKPLFKVNLRVLASAPTKFAADDILDGLIGGFNQFGSPRRNEFKIVKPKKVEKLIYDFIFRNFDDSKTMILSSEEIASFFHLPISSSGAPKIKWLKSKQSPPPSNLPNNGILIGESNFHEERKPIYITNEDRMRHIYIIGQTGTGKSTILANMFLQDIKEGRGLAVIDPHGDLVQNALSFIPKERIDDVIYFDPGDLERPLGLNMLEYNFSRPEEKTFIVNEFINMFDKLYDLKQTGGPMFEQYMRNALLLLMEDMINEEATLIEIPRIFTDDEYRERKLSRINNPIVIDFWEKEAAKVGGEASLANITPYITSKFNNFIANDYMRPIIGQAKSAFNFRNVMDEGKILLVNLSKGRIGDINAGLLGMIFVGKILMSALSRVDTHEKERKDFYLYIDEFQNFTTDSISTILSEARKYRLSLTIAHQFIAQLNEKIRDSIFGNVGSQIIFRVGIQDAEFLVKQFEPIFDINDLTNINNLNAYVKILINGEVSKPFNIEILKTSWSSGNKDQIEKIKEYSRLKYGKEKLIIEEEIYKRLRN